MYYSFYFLLAKTEIALKQRILIHLEIDESSNILQF